jgi:hypothetical protein
MQHDLVRSPTTRKDLSCRCGKGKKVREKRPANTHVISEAVCSETHFPWALLDGKRGLAAETLKRPRPNPSILQHLNHVVRKTVWTRVMRGNTRKGVDDRTARQFSPFILALHRGRDASHPRHCRRASSPLHHCSLLSQCPRRHCERRMPS